MHKKTISTWEKETKRFLRSRPWQLLRKLTFQYFEKKCTSCGSTANIHLDHIISRFNDNNGERWLDITNLQPLCEYCNSIKNTKNTDYRNTTHEERAEKLKPIFEKALNDIGYTPSWILMECTINDEHGKNRAEWKQKIRACVKNGMTYDEIINKFNIITSTLDYKYINYYINFILSDQFSDKKEKRKEKKRRNKLNKKAKDKKLTLLDNLYKERYHLSKEQLIKSIEFIARTAL